MIFCTCFDRARLAEMVDFWRCSTLFDFPRGYQGCFICRISRISEDYWSILDFSKSLGFSHRLPKVTEDVLFDELVGFPLNIDFFNDVWFAIYAVFLKLFCTWFDSARFAKLIGFPKTLNKDYQRCSFRRSSWADFDFPQRSSICWISRMTEDVRPEIRSFPKVTKDLDRKSKYWMIREWVPLYNEFKVQFGVLRHP